MFLDPGVASGTGLPVHILSFLKPVLGIDWQVLLGDGNLVAEAHMSA